MIPWRRQQVSLLQKRLASVSYLLKAGIDDGATGNEDDIPPRCNALQAQTGCFAHEAASTIAAYSLTDTPAGREAKAAVR